MDKRCQQLFKGKRIEFPLATGVTSHVSLVYDEKKNPYLLCFTSMHEEKAEFTVPLNGCRIINNITEIGPCIHIITSYEEYQFQCSSKEEFNDMSQFFNMLGFPILGFKNVYVLNKKIGKGSFSTAYIGTNTLYGNRVVIKEVDKSKVKESNVYTEIEVLRKVMHKYVIKLISAYEQEGYVYLVLEYLKGGELFEYLNNHGPYSEEDAKKAMRRILIALGALHSNGVVHRDLKMENLMLENPNDPCSLKIIDFGLASFLNTSSMNMRCGSPGYVAPEILKYAPYGTKVDIFSLGVILFNILCGYPPFRGSNVKEIFRKNVRCNISFNTKHWLDKSNSVKEIISWMCCKNPDNRCTAIQALGHPWFLPKLTDMYMMKAVEDVKPKDNNSTLVSENSSTKTSDSSNNSSTITKAADTQYQLLKQQDLYKKSKNGNAENGNYNNENDTNENNNGKTYDSLQNKKMNLKNYKTYFDTLLKTDDKHSDIKTGAKKNTDDHSVHAYNKKNFDGYPKSEIEHEKVTLQGKPVVPTSNCSSSLIPNVTTKKRDVQRVTSHKNIRIKSDEKLKKIIKEEIAKGRNSVDAKRYAANF